MHWPSEAARGLASIGKELVRRAAQLRPDHLGDLRELHPLRRLREEPRHHAARPLPGARRGPSQGLTELSAAPFSSPSVARMRRPPCAGHRPDALAGELATRPGSEEIAGRARGEVRQPLSLRIGGRDVIVRWPIRLSVIAGGSRRTTG